MATLSAISNLDNLDNHLLFLHYSGYCNLKLHQISNIQVISTGVGFLWKDGWRMDRGWRGWSKK
jgi:hypothetical protein